MFTKNKHQFFELSCLIFSLLVFFILLKFSQNLVVKNPNDFGKFLLSKKDIFKLVWTINLGFYLCLALIIVLTNFFLKSGYFIGWYLGFVLFLIPTYVVAISNLYYDNSVVKFIFFSLSNMTQLGTVICGLRIFQNLTGFNDDAKFRQLTLFATFGLLCCNVSYFIKNLDNFTDNQAIVLTLNLIFVLSFFIIIVECFKVLKRGVKEKKRFSDSFCGVINFS